MELTKKYRCVAGTDRVAKFNPYTEMTGITGSTLPHLFETDDIDEMRRYVEEQGILIAVDDS